MLYTIEQDLDICIELKLSPTQLFFLKMLVLDRTISGGEAAKKSYYLTLKYQNELKGIPANELSDLVARNIIVDTNKFGSSSLDYYEIHPDMTHYFTLKAYPMVNQLHDAYPNFFFMNGRKFSAKSCTIDEISKEYIIAINKDVKEHERILEDIKWARENDAIVIGLKKFVGARYWNAIRELRKRKTDNKTSTDVTIL